MAHLRLSVSEVLDQLEAHHGVQEPVWPVDPYESLIWWHCGYPASDERCTRGWDALKKTIGSEPEQILRATQGKLVLALKAGGMVPEVRAMRMQQIAERVMKEFGGDLRSGLKGDVSEVRKRLKRFPGIADPGADRILLFGKVKPIAAVPSNCPQVLVRIQLGLERENYGVTYGEAESLIKAEVAEKFAPRQRAYLLLKEHGQSICKRIKPKCNECPISAHCAYFSGRDRGRSRVA
jgi:endonuclease-3